MITGIFACRTGDGIEETGSCDLRFRVDPQRVDMSQIFLSYSRTDRTNAARVVDELHDRGWSVWWDSKVEAGQAWEREIEREIARAVCVVVLWSHSSVLSQWVRAEVGVAVKRGILVPAKISNVELPVFYQTIQTADLTSWLATGNDIELARFLDDVGATMQRAAEVREAPQELVIQRDLDDAEQGSSAPVGRSQSKADRRVSARTLGGTSVEARQTASVRRKLTPNVRQKASAAARRSRRASLSADLDNRVNLFVEVDRGPTVGRPEVENSGIALYANASVEDALRFSLHTSVKTVDLADPIVPGVVQRNPHPPDAPLRRGHERPNSNVLIGIIDLGGFDFSHPDFLNERGRTRFVRIWDQGGQIRAAPKGFGFGSEITQTQMDAALFGEGSAGVRAWQLEPQSAMAAGSRATHLASVAGGNRGVCPHAQLAGVLLSQPEPNGHPLRFDSRLIARGVDYLVQLAGACKMPLSIAIGVGTTSAAHDASNAVAKWIDAYLEAPGRCISVGASRGYRPIPGLFPQWNEWFQRVHTAGRVRDAGLIERIEWIINGNGVVDPCENALHIWYDRQDRFGVDIVSPDGDRIGPIETGESLDRHVFRDGTVISLYHDRLAAGSESNHIACYLKPLPARGAGVRAGTWTVRLHGREVRDGRYHGWILRDDTSAWSPGSATLSLPAYLSQRSSVPGYALTGIACASRVLTVANLDVGNEVIHWTSAKGPTRDGRQKPEIAAPGTDMVGANGFDPSNPLWVSMTGSSVAAAYTAGVAGLMLACEPRLSARDIAEIVTRTARPLPGGDFGWHDDAGFGCLDPENCLHESERIHVRSRK